MKFEIYKDTSNLWRWRLLNGDGNIIAVSGEGHLSKNACEIEITLVKSRDLSLAVLAEGN